MEADQFHFEQYLVGCAGQEQQSGAPPRACSPAEGLKKLRSAALSAPVALKIASDNEHHDDYESRDGRDGSLDAASKSNGGLVATGPKGKRDGPVPSCTVLERPRSSSAR
jgi:hypothetical protein